MTRPSLTSLSLCAVGLAVAACGPATDNPGDCVERLLAGDVVISEILADASAPQGASGADEGREWFEIYNGSGRAVDLEGLTIIHSRPDGSRGKQHVIGSLPVPIEGYIVLGNVAQDLRPQWVTYGYGADLGDMYNSEGGKLSLRCGDKVVDEAGYDEVSPGRSWQFDGGAAPDYTANDDPKNWCEAAEPDSFEFDATNFGTPGEQNQDCVVTVAGQCTDDSGAMRPTVAPAIGDLVITEVMPSPSAVSDATGEWFEVEVRRAVDLNGLVLDRAGDNANGVALQAEECLRVVDGNRLVFARSTASEANGMLPKVDGTFSFSLVGGTAENPGDVRLMMNDAVIDAVTWLSSRNGRSLQVDPDSATPAGNDMPAAWCDGTSTYGAGDFGTPGTANVQCSVAPVGMCMDGANNRPVVSPTVGQLVITEFMASPAGDDTDEEWFEIRNVSGQPFDLNGLQLDRAGDAAAPNIVSSATCLRVAAGAHGLFARSALPSENDMLPAVDATFSFALVAAGDIRVLDSAGAELDSVTWTTAPAATARQLDPDSQTPAGSVEANFCSATTPYGAATNKGTPKAANLQCP